MNAKHRQRGNTGLAVGGALALAIVTGFAGYWFGTRNSAHTAPAATNVAAQAQGDAGAGKPPTDEAGRRVLYWHDPMVPGQRFDKPGKSPFMDMLLVPVYADAAADQGQVSISPRLAQSFGVRTVEAKEGTLETGFTAVGAVEVDERSIVAVQARVQGFVERLLVRATFDTVRAGQPLAELYVPEWLAAQEELLALKASALPGAAPLVDAARQRLRLIGMPDAEIARVEREGRVANRVTLTAPQGGIVWEIGARDGMAVMPGTTLFRLASLGSVWVVAEVPEAQAGLLREGASVEARATAFPERVFKGRVATLLPEVSATTRTVRARIVLDNPGGALKPGMFATVAFGGARAKPAVLIPSEAVIHTGNRTVVVVAAGEGRFAPVDVVVGRESGDLTEIRKGLAPGQRVVSSGQFLIDSEASLRGVLARMNVGDGKDGAASAKGDADPQAGQGAPRAAGAVRHKGEGVVRSVGSGELLIQHGPLESAGMGAMTMAFKAPPSGVPAGVKEGTRIAFEFTLTPQGEIQLATVTALPDAAPRTKGAPR